MADIPVESEIITISQDVTGQPIAFTYNFDISKAPAPTSLTVEWELTYTATTRYENLDTANVAIFRNTRHFNVSFTIASFMLAMLSPDANFSLGPDRRHTYDGTTDYAGLSGRTTVRSITYVQPPIVVTIPQVIAALTGTGNAVLVMHVFTTDGKTPPAGAGVAAWNDEDLVEGTLIATLT